MEKNKILIAYFSRSGQNYYHGKIIDLKIGNTEVAAKKIQSLTGATLFKIEPVKDYPKGYNETTKVAMEELRTKARPELADQLETIDFYDVILLGFPSWWGTMPMPVFTFLEEFRWKNKRIIPFCTHEGSGFGDSIRDIEKTCSNSKVDDGLEVLGYQVGEMDDRLRKWLNRLEISIE